VQKDFEVFIGKGEQAQGRDGGLLKGGLLGYVEKKKKKKRKENECEEDCF
jgi:hypothetical protein